MHNHMEVSGWVVGGMVSVVGWGGVGCVLARVRGFDRNIRGVDNSVNTSPPEAFLNRRPL